MTNVYGKPEKLAVKTRLFEIGVSVLEKQGWKVERIPGSGKSSVRRITKGGESKVVSIRTTQDRWIAFPRTEGDRSWRTLDEVDEVVAVSVNDRHNPTHANIHMLPGDEVRDRFNRAYAARKAAGYQLPIGRGIWVSLYRQESNDPVTHVGAGAGLKFPAIASVPLDAEVVATDEAAGEHPSSDDGPLTIAEAKRRLALTFGVDPANIKITVEA